MLNLIFILVLLLQLENSLQHNCVEHLPRLNEIVTDYVGENSTRMKLGVMKNSFSAQTSSFTQGNIRILYEYTAAFNNLANSSVIKARILEPARFQLQAAIGVRYASNEVLRVERQCSSNNYRVVNGERGCSIDCVTTSTCLNIEVPSKYLKRCKTVSSSGTVRYSGTDGVGAANTDIVILVSAESCPTNALAYANSCFRDSYDRPTLGVVNVCPGVFTTGRKFEENIKVIKHEILHALGISVTSFAYFRYTDGTPIVPRNIYGWPNTDVVDNSYYSWNSVIGKTVQRSRSSISTTSTKTYNTLVTPNLLAQARKHFNCPTLDGVDLEDFGGSGSASSHFDELAYNTEMMSPQSDNNLDTFSILTLALLYDSGWYVVNVSSAERLDYGYNSGCTIPMEGCYKYMKENPASNNFCTNPVESPPLFSCDGNYFHYCNLFKQSIVMPEKYRYFTSLNGIPAADVNFYSGGSEFNEFCPTYAVTSAPSGFCKDLGNIGLPSVINKVSSYFGADSQCLNNRNVTVTVNNNTLFGAACHKIVATSGNNIQFEYNNTVVNCVSGTWVKFTDTSGNYEFFCELQKAKAAVTYPEFVEFKSPTKTASKFNIYLGLQIIVLIMCFILGK